MTERDERRAQMWSYAKLTKVALPFLEDVDDLAERLVLEGEYVAMQNILDELAASQRDREALAEARGLLAEFGGAYGTKLADLLERSRTFLKRTENTDD